MANAKVKDVRDMTNDLLSQNNSKSISTEEINRYMKASNLELFDECTGATNKRTNGQTLVNYGRNNNTDSRLEPFKKSETISVVDGEATLPADCKKILSITLSKKKPKAITRIDDDRVGMLFDNPLREPDENDIYYLEGEDRTLQIFGLTDSIFIRYLKTPVTPVYSTKEIEVTAGSRTVKREVYDPSTSIDFEWDESELLDLVTRVVQKVGVSLRDGFIEQVSQVTKNNE